MWLTKEVCESVYKALQTRYKDLANEPFNQNLQNHKLDSILGSVKQTFQGKNLNPTVLDATIAYYYQLNTGHPFYTGNKRMAEYLTYVFLRLNSVELSLSSIQYATLTLLIALGKKAGIKESTVKNDLKFIFLTYSKDVDTVV